ncbi:hypothetical protein JXR93_08860 [bacterium]|nr:hypothetical protein [bacterium]
MKIFIYILLMLSILISIILRGDELTEKTKTQTTKSEIKKDKNIDSKTEINIQDKKENIFNVPYTYWWPSGGPFISLCGEKYSMVFLGTVDDIEEPIQSDIEEYKKFEKLYIPQNGVIKVEEILVVNNIEKTKLSESIKNIINSNLDKNSELFFKSDCFYNSKLKKGDKTTVFIYFYEGDLSIPSNSIIKIDSFNSDIVESIKTYIKNNQNPLSIKKDLKLWKRYSLDKALKENIECYEYQEKQ